MKKEVTLKEPRHFNQALTYLDEVSKCDELHICIIKAHKESLSERQRAYYWVVLEFIQNHSGSFKDELHLEYKKMFLVDIFCQHPDDYPGFGEMVQELRDLWTAGHGKKAVRFYAHVVEGCSIMKAKRPHMAEYIDRIIMHASEFHGIAVPSAEPDILRR